MYPAIGSLCYIRSCMTPGWFHAAVSGQWALPGGRSPSSRTPLSVIFLCAHVLGQFLSLWCVLFFLLSLTSVVERGDRYMNLSAGRRCDTMRPARDRLPLELQPVQQWRHHLSSLKSMSTTGAAPSIRGPTEPLTGSLQCYRTEAGITLCASCLFDF